MRTHLGAPIAFDREAGGYSYASSGEHPYELPGLWFSASELIALLTVQQLLTEAQPGLLESSIAPLRNRIEQILRTCHPAQDQVGKRVRILRMASRRGDSEHFPAIAGAVLKRKRLLIMYHGRSRNETTERLVSPQRIIHYRDNWYLDAWDHSKRGLRSFSVDRIKKARALDIQAKEIAEEKLNSHFASAYGIFAGRANKKAILRFSPERSRWVADEVWHPKQKGGFENGRYVLEIPYGDSRELVMDILKHGPEVEVLAPESLRVEVRDRLARSIAQYQTDGSQKRSIPRAGSNRKKDRSAVHRLTF